MKRLQTHILNELTTVDDQEDEDDDVISIEDVQPAVTSPFEALSAIRQLDLFFTFFATRSQKAIALTSQKSSWISQPEQSTALHLK